MAPDAATQSSLAPAHETLAACQQCGTQLAVLPAHGPHAVVTDGPCGYRGVTLRFDERRVQLIMRTFRCTCGARVFFENSRCLSCSRELGFLPDAVTLVPIEPSSLGNFTTSFGNHKKCANYVEQGVCNWMVPSASPSTLCAACQLNHVIPDLSEPKNRALWREVENSKRRLIYTLARLKLPLQSKRDNPQLGLAFDIKADTASGRVLTGHDDGLITLNLAEADPAQREQIRISMKERYRTMLGHFRHEIGHYYWDRLISGTARISGFRKVFGDETLNYQEALKRHYAAESTTKGYEESFISAYATVHPWEDFAETFAHYLHIEDTLETAQDFGLATALGTTPNVAEVRDFSLLMRQWFDVTVALNALNRSMGLLDAYPFVISPGVQRKLEFVHELVLDA